MDEMERDEALEDCRQMLGGISLESLAELTKLIGLSDPDYDDELTAVGYSSSLDMTKAQMLSARTKAALKKRAQEITFDDLRQVRFDLAHKLIELMPLANRIKHLRSLEQVRTYLYKSIDNYGEKVTRDEIISPAVFMSTMGRIKHLEIIQQWLFAIE